MASNNNKRKHKAAGPIDQDATRRGIYGRESVEATAAKQDREYWVNCICDSQSERRAAGCDLLTFAAMTHDLLRMRSFERDIYATVPGKRVLEVGTGALAPLTLMCLQAGALEVITVERTAWAAEAARELLAPHRNCTVIGPRPAESLRTSDVGGNGHFDVLVHEIYGCVGSSEGVVETIAALHAAGFSFGSVVSRGCEVLVAPCTAPPTDDMWLANPMVALCGNPGGEAGLEQDMCTHNWGVHSPPSALLLAAPQLWHKTDLEAKEFPPPPPPALLQFELAPTGSGGSAGALCAGFLFSSRFLFHDAADTLDTLLQASASIRSAGCMLYAPSHCCCCDARTVFMLFHNSSIADQC